MVTLSAKDKVLYEMVSVLADAVLALEYIAIGLIFEMKESTDKTENLKKLDDVQTATGKYIDLIAKWHEQ